METFRPRIRFAYLAVASLAVSLAIVFVALVPVIARPPAAVWADIARGGESEVLGSAALVVLISPILVLSVLYLWGRRRQFVRLGGGRIEVSDPAGVNAIALDDVARLERVWYEDHRGNRADVGSRLTTSDGASVQVSFEYGPPLVAALRRELAPRGIRPVELRLGPHDSLHGPPPIGSESRKASARSRG